MNIKNGITLLTLLLCLFTTPLLAQPENNGDGADNGVNAEEPQEREEIKGLPLLGVELLAQVDQNELSWKKNWKEGQAAMERGEVNVAIEYFKQAMAKKPTKKYIALHIAHGYYLLRDYPSSKDWYSIALNTGSDCSLASYHYALVLKQLGEYDQALPIFNNFSKMELKKDEQNKFKTYAKIEAAGIIMGQEMMDTLHSHKAMMLDGGINQATDERSPYWYNNGLVYSSNDFEVTTLSGGESMTETYSRIYSSREVNGSWADGAILNGIGDNASVSHPTVSADGNTLYYTVCVNLGDVEQLCTIHKSTKNDGSWGAGTALGASINANASSNAYPSIGTDENGNTVLFFASNRTKGRGGMDIFMSIMNENGEFGPAKNVAAPINTARDEISPFWDNETATLYFASTGHVGLGGYDIYSTKLDASGDWTEPMNLGMNVNSPADDYDYSTGDVANLGFFASNRAGGVMSEYEYCCDDIYMARKNLYNFAVTGSVFKEEGGKNVRANGGMVTLYKASNDSVIAKFDAKSIPVYIIRLPGQDDYRLEAKMEGYKDAVAEFSTMDYTQEDTLTVDLVLKPARESYLNEVVGTVFFDFNKFQLTPEAPTTLNAVVDFIKKHPELKFEIGGHTDDVGSSKYNMELSEKRAQAVAKYIYSKDISKEQVSVKGYGETEPLQPNVNDDGSDNPEGRAKNRRVEFKVIEESKK